MYVCMYVCMTQDKKNKFILIKNVDLCGQFVAAAERELASM